MCLREPTKLPYNIESDEMTAALISFVVFSSSHNHNLSGSPKFSRLPKSSSGGTITSYPNFSITCAVCLFDIGLLSCGIYKILPAAFLSLCLA